MRHETPWRVVSPEMDKHAFDVLDAGGHLVHRGSWGYRETATLISAAPELLAALREMLYGSDDDAALDAAWDAAVAAIEKAEGR